MTALTTRGHDAATALPRLLPSPAPAVPLDWAAHTRRHGSLEYAGRPDALIGEAEAAGLTGRGGAAFPVHRKLRSVLDAAGRRRRAPVVIANGAESEPASEKDATLLWLAPHLVLDGLQLAAAAVGADRAVLCVHPGPGHQSSPGASARRGPDLAGRLREAIAARQSADRVPVQLALASPRFLSGQETALVSQLSGGPAIPFYAAERVAERGLDGRPTLVQNAETLAHLALIARHGAGWFRGVGTPDEPGSVLATVRRADGTTRITEVPLGIGLRELTGPAAADDAVLLGGYHGTWLSGRQALGLTLDNRALTAAGARLGAGVVIVLPAGRCGLVETARVVRYLALESAGQCGPCLNGLPRIAAALAELAAGRARPEAVADLARWCGLVTGRGACHHPDGTARLVRSALVTFADEVGRHQHGRCSAGDPRPFLPVPDPARTDRPATDPANTAQDWS